MGRGARYREGADRPAGSVLRPGRHVALGTEAGDRPGPCGDVREPDRSSGSRRSGRAGRREGRAAASNVKGIAMSLSSPSSVLNVDIQPGKPPMLRVDATGDAAGWAAAHRNALRAA